jgi:L-aminopeptidase/D-esterase-like protein
MGPMRHRAARCLTLSLVLWVSVASAADPKPRARDLGIPFDGTPGELNAITDVPGIEVGFTTLMMGGGQTIAPGPQVRTGVTAILPRGKGGTEPVFAGVFSQNGNGEMTGTHWIRESGFLDGPVMITNTHSVGVVRDAVIAWQVQHGFVPKTSSVGDSWWSMPVVAETYDGPPLNDVNGFHVKPEHVFMALDMAAGGAVREGNVGGGTGMHCYQFKGGTGTASRRVVTDGGTFTIGVLVQCNCGSRYQLTVRGVPVGREIPMPPPPKADATAPQAAVERGSIIIVVATDAPLLPGQLERLARRATMGLARTGSSSGNYSGDIFLAFSTANSAATTRPIATLTMFSNDLISPLFEATAQATEEAILNALVRAETMTGAHGEVSEALPHDQLRAVMKKYNRLTETPAAPRAAHP